MVKNIIYMVEEVKFNEFFEFIFFAFNFMKNY